MQAKRAQREQEQIPTATEAVDALAATALRISTETAIAALTDAGRDFMEAVGAQRFDFFDEGIVAGSGNWGENMSWQFASITARTPRSVSASCRAFPSTDFGT